MAISELIEAETDYMLKETAALSLVVSIEHYFMYGAIAIVLLWLIRIWRREKRAKAKAPPQENTQ